METTPHESITTEMLRPSGNDALIVSASTSWSTVEAFQEALGIEATRVAVKPAGEPWSDEVDELAGWLRAIGVSRIVAIGGGSTIDYAKAAGLGFALKASICSFEFSEVPAVELPAIVAVPTIPGSGSEATPYAVVRNSSTGRKFTVASQSMLPATVVLEPRFLPTVALGVLAGPVLDAYCHAIEAASNPHRPAWLGELAASSVARISRAAPLPWRHESVQVSEDLIRAGTDAGRCIAVARTGLPHTLSVALAELSPLSHGLLVAHSMCASHDAGLLDSTPLDERVQAVLSDLGFKSHASRGSFSRAAHWISQTLAEVAVPSPLPIKSPAKISRVADRVFQDAGLREACGGEVSRPQLEALLAGEVGMTNG